jgi:hypothetical protein
MEQSDTCTITLPPQHPWTFHQLIHTQTQSHKLIIYSIGLSKKKTFSRLILYFQNEAYSLWRGLRRMGKAVRTTGQVNKYKLRLT